MRSSLLQRPGAVALDVEGGGSVAAHYGEPLPEQRRLAEGAGLVDRSDRDVVAVPGPDRLSWLHDLTSQHLRELPDATGTEALFLDPNGRVEHHAVLTELAGTTWADVEPGTGAALTGWLQKMQFMLRVEPELRTAGWALLSLVGPQGDAVLTAAGWPVPAAEHAVVPLDGGGWARRMPAIGDGTAAVVDLLVPRAEVAARADALLAAGAVLAGLDAYEGLRVEARRPRAGIDSDHRTIPNELVWLDSAVHLDKGCYRGQETVARVHNLGRPPRRQVLLHLDGMSEVLPAPGTPVTAGTREVGRVGSVVRHHELGVIGLALVKQSVAPDADLRVGEAVAVIDPDDAPAALDDTRAAARDRVRAVRSATIGR
ncbi:MULTISPECIES: CAF17-like 4Fe-4S cluster assembly/insertion protein YgfZ [unclassified Modestobacter]|uniref:CAF17-like 4Fe-4S cluster assembly/insertion protein YgfZ n=1 Tax=unclassified Modestobacter TaxID=2643866 RepID=UPI0022AB49B2|nr:MULTISPECIES: folate-binding protein [unclassified Modestobacter]MCZ2823508.1 folate-binding protein [Modestobacter sp. VKM Ac-2981]MCZ2851753.1 folate-binding protein [Modestobacter sp. VKM Ac-2982]